MSDSTYCAICEERVAVIEITTTMSARALRPEGADIIARVNVRAIAVGQVPLGSGGQVSRMHICGPCYEAVPENDEDRDRYQAALTANTERVE